MSFSYNNPLIIGDINAKIKAEIGNLDDLETTDKSSLVNALNEAINSTLNGASRDLDNLSDTGNDKLRSLNSYANEGELLTDADGLAFVEKYAHSTFDRSKFTVIGSPNITDDGVASGFGQSTGIYFDKTVSLEGSEFYIPKSSGTGQILCGGNADVNVLNGVYFNQISATSLKIVGRNSSSINVFSIDKTVSASTKVYKIVFKNNTISLYEDGVLNSTPTSVDYSSVITVKRWYIGTQYNAQAADANSGSIDLKQFSITVDGVVVFSGNKTGIDTIKPDDYTTDGNLTVSNNGILSFSNYDADAVLKKDGIAELNTSVSDLEFDGAFIQYQQGLIYNSDWGSFIRIENKGTSVGFRFVTTGGNWFIDYSLDYTIQLGKKHYFKAIIKDGKYSFGIRKENENWTIATGNLSSSSYTPYFANFRIKPISALATNQNVYDLNVFKIYVNGDLVYQPCLKIPYTESKTGSKIVDSIYRNRVNDMADQFGYANYYTLQDEAKGNYQVVGSPTISSDFVLSNTSQANYVKGTLSNYFWNNFEIKFSDIQCQTTSAIQVFFDIYGAGGNRVMLRKNANGQIQLSITVNNTGTLLKYFNESSTINGMIGYDGTKYYWTVNGVSDTLTSASVLPQKDYTIYFGCFYDLTGGGLTNGYIDLKAFKIYVDNKLAYEAVIEPNFTLPQVELYGLIGQRTLRDSYRNGINYWELYSNRDLEQGGSCTSGVEVALPKPFADTNYVLSVPYSAKSATAFTPTQTGDWIAKGKGVL